MEEKAKIPNLCLSNATCSQMISGIFQKGSAQILISVAMSETFHHWGTAESRWWCFVAATFGAVGWSEEEYLSGAHRTVRRSACTFSYLILSLAA